MERRVLTGAHVGSGFSPCWEAVMAEIKSTVRKPYFIPNNVNNFQLWNGCCGEIPASSISMSTSRSLSRGEPVNVRSPLL